VGYFWSNPEGSTNILDGGQDTRRTRVERESGQNSGARRVDRAFLPLSAALFSLLLGQTGGRGSEAAGGGSKGRSTGGDAKPTFGILSVIPGRDLFSS